MSRALCRYVPGLARFLLPRINSLALLTAVTTMTCLLFNYLHVHRQFWWADAIGILVRLDAHACSHRARIDHIVVRDWQHVAIVHLHRAYSTANNTAVHDYTTRQVRARVRDARRCTGTFGRADGADTHSGTDSIPLLATRLPAHVRHGGCTCATRRRRAASVGTCHGEAQRSRRCAHGASGENN